MLTLLIIASSALTGLPDTAAAAARDTVLSMPEVVVTSTRMPTEREWSPSPVARRELDSRFSPQAASAGTAVEGMPGLLVRSYGGAGAVQTLSVRGTGAEGALVLIDGIPVGNRQTGQTDLGTIPALLLKKAELRRGGGSSLYGSEAVGGVLNLATRSPGDAAAVEAFGSTASFGGASAGIVLDVPASGLAAVSAGFQSVTQRGDYPYRTGGGDVLLREDADLRSVAAYAIVETKMPNIYTNKVLISFVSSDKGAPGPVLSSLASPVARQAEYGVIVTDALSVTPPGPFRFRMSLAGRDNWLRYVDPGASVPVDNFYRNRTLFTAPAVEFDAGEREHLLAGAELAVDWASGNAIDSEKRRGHAACVVSSSLGPYPFREGGPGVSAFPSLRVDAFDGFGTVASAGIGVSIGSSLRMPAVVIHSAFGNNFRAPTFNELYYAGGGGVGNPGLGAERSTSFDCGVTLRADAAGHHELDLTWFQITTHDRIIWLPLGSPFVWSARNVGTTRSRGLELSYDWRVIPDRLSLEASYTTTDAERIAPGDPTAGSQLIYVPLDEGSVEARGSIPFSDAALVLGVADRYTGVRYTVEDGTASLPGAHLLDIDIGVEAGAFGSRLAITYALRNAADLNYQLMPGYPMPGRNHGLSIRLARTL